MLLWGVLLGLGFALGAGCANGAFHNYRARINQGGAGRFALVIEADRTPIEGTHFLLDTATGDVWRMDSSDGRRGSWLRLGDAPEDVRDLEAETEAEDDA
jgi:hypothetical protein